MRRSEHWAVARRDELLGRTRAISLAVVGTAAAASLGLGMVFAHETPGHASTVIPASPTPPAGSSGGATPHHTSRKRKLAAPPQQPAPTSAAPQVSSGGS
jgi:hypothetical protein